MGPLSGPTLPTLQPWDLVPRHDLSGGPSVEQTGTGVFTHVALYRLKLMNYVELW